MKNKKLFGWNIDEPKSKIEMILSHLIHNRKIDTWIDRETHRYKRDRQLESGIGR